MLTDTTQSNGLVNQEDDDSIFLDGAELLAQIEREEIEEQEAERKRAAEEQQRAIDRTLANIDSWPVLDDEGKELDKEAAKRDFLGMTERWESNVGRWHDGNTKWLGMSFKPTAEDSDGLDEYCPAYLGGHTFFDHGLTQLIRAASWALHVPESMCAAIVLHTISSGCGKGVRISFKDGEETSLGLFIKMIAESGSGKSKAGELLSHPVKAIHEERIKNFAEKVKPTLEAKRKLAANKVKQLEKDADGSEESLKEMVDAQAEVERLTRELQAPNIYFSDVTVERLSQSLPATNEQISFLTFEGGTFLQNLLGRYNKDDGTDDSLICSLYSMEGSNQGRVTRDDVTLTRPWGSLCVAIQPSKWNTLVSSETLREDGFLARCLSAEFRCQPQFESKNSNPRKVPSALLDHYGDKFRRIFEAYRQTAETSDDYKVIRVSKYGREFMTDFQNEVTAFMRKTSAIRPFVARWVENAKRLAGVLHVAYYGDKAHEHEVQWQTVVYAIKAMRFFIARQKALLAQYMKDPEVEKFREVYNAAGRCMSKREIDRLRSPSWEKVLEWAKNSKGLMLVTETTNEKGVKSLYVHHPAIGNPAEFKKTGGKPQLLSDSIPSAKKTDDIVL